MPKQSSQTTPRRNAPHRVRIRRRGAKGGRSILQRVTEGVENTTKRVGLKGGAAALATGAAGMAVGMTLGGIARAVMARSSKQTMKKRMDDIAEDAEHIKEAIKDIKA